MCYWPLVNMGDSGCALASCWEWRWTYVYTFHIDCVVSENIHVSPTEAGLFYMIPPVWKFQLSVIQYFKLVGLAYPPTYTHTQTDRHPPQGNSIPLCGRSMNVFWNCTLCLSLEGILHMLQNVWKKLKISSTIIKLALYMYITIQKITSCQERCS